MAHSYHETPIGMMRAVWEKKTDGQWWLVELNPEKKVGETSKEVTAEAKKLQRNLEKYFSGKKIDWQKEVNYVLQGGTDFQIAVWEEIDRIGFGEKSSYSQIAAKIGRPRAVRAVGSAVSKNPVSIIVGCHRVLAKNGSIGGFAWGLSAKRTLLAVEKIESKN